MPYKKGGEAYKRSLERKKAKRRIARLEKEINTAKTAKEQIFYKQQVKALREQMSKTYQFDPLSHKATGFTKDDLKIAARNLTRMNVHAEIGRGEQARKNFLTQQELNTAESYSLIGPRLGEFSSEEVKIFYRATQKAWEGVSNENNRNEAILKYYGRTDLREFVREVLEMNKKAVSYAEEDYGYPMQDENEMAKDLESDREGSPEFLGHVVSPEQYAALESYIEEPSFEILDIPTFD